MMCYYLNVYFQGQSANKIFSKSEAETEQIFRVIFLQNTNARCAIFSYTKLHGLTEFPTRFDARRSHPQGVTS